MSRNMRSIGAVIAGALAGIALSIGTDVLLRAAGIFPQTGQAMSDPHFVLATAYRTIYGVLGAYVAARLAPARPMFHALVLGALGLVATVAGAVVTWNSVPSVGPHWYSVALVVLAIPPAWAGGKLRLLQLQRQPH